MKETNVPIPSRERLDLAAASRGLARSRSAAQDLIRRGAVSVNGVVVDKPNALVSPESVIELLRKDAYVSRAGEKLAHAIKEWKIDLNGLVVVDIGSSTGGFTDCALQNGAEKVFAIDVGSDQLDQSLRENEKVTVMEQTDIRKVAELSPVPDVAVIDTSFISLTLILEHAKRLTQKKGFVIALIKPQFEVGRDIAKKYKGVIRDEAQRKNAVDRVIAFAESIGFKSKGVIDSPIEGSDGNKEYLAYLVKA